MPYKNFLQLTFFHELFKFQTTGWSKTINVLQVKFSLLLHCVRKFLRGTILIFIFLILTFLGTSSMFFPNLPPDLPILTSPKIAASRTRQSIIAVCSANVKFKPLPICAPGTWCQLGRSGPNLRVFSKCEIWPRPRRLSHLISDCISGPDLLSLLGIFTRLFWRTLTE